MHALLPHFHFAVGILENPQLPIKKFLELRNKVINAYIFVFYCAYKPTQNGILLCSRNRTNRSCKKLK